MKLAAKRIESSLELGFVEIQFPGQLKKLKMINFRAKRLDLAAFGAEMRRRSLCPAMWTSAAQDFPAIFCSFSHLNCYYAFYRTILTPTKKMVESLGAPTIDVCQNFVTTRGLR